MLAEVEVKNKVPLDLVFEVLTWCDVDTLASHKLVCKEWRSILASSQFINLHLQRSKTIRGFFLQSVPGERKFYSSFVTPSSQQPALSLDFLPGDVKIQASTCDQSGHGLLLCSTYGVYDVKYYVCKEWILIPSPNRNSTTIKMGMAIMGMGCPPVFKILRLSLFINCNTGSRTYYTEVFDSLKWGWQVSCTSTSFDFSRLSLLNHTVVFVNASFYWLSFPSLIISFDLETYEWSQVELPQAFVAEKAVSSDENVKNDINLRLVNRSGNLALVVKNENKIDVWVMLSKVSQCWEKESFKLEMGWRDSVIGFFAVDVALVMKPKHAWASSILWYDFEKNQYREAGKDRKVEFCEVHLFQSDYICCKIGERNGVPQPNIYRQHSRKDCKFQSDYVPCNTGKWNAVSQPNFHHQHFRTECKFQSDFVSCNISKWNLIPGVLL